MAMELALRAHDLDGSVGGRWAGRVRILTLLRIAPFALLIGNLGRLPAISSGSKEAPILLNDGMVVALVAAGIFLALRHRTLRIDGTVVCALGFMTVAALGLLTSGVRYGLTPFELAFSAAYLVRWAVYFALYLLVLNFVRGSEREQVWLALENAVLIFAVFGIFQSAFLPGFAQMVYPDSQVGYDWDYQGRRLVSTILDPNFAGLLIVMVLLVMLARVAYGVRVAVWKPLVLLLAAGLTVSRSSALALMVGLVVLVAGRGLSRRMLRVIGVAFLLTLPALPFLIQYAIALNKFAIDASALGRIFSWLIALEVFLDNPVVGIGFNSFGFVTREYGYSGAGASSFGADGGLLFIAVTTGLLGLSLYLGMIASIIRRCRRKWLNGEASGAERGMALGTTAATMALLVHSVFVNSIVHPLMLEPLWILWGLSMLTDRVPDATAGSKRVRPRLVTVG